MNLTSLSVIGNRAKEDTLVRLQNNHASRKPRCNHLKLFPTLCEPIDDLLGGGVEGGLLTQIYGVAGSGKTSISLQCALNCLSKGLKAVFIDADSSFPRRRLLQISRRFENLDLNNFLLLSPHSFPELSDIIDSIEVLIREGVGLVVLDSVASLYRYATSLDREENVYFSMELCRQMAMLLHVAEHNNLAMIILNQVREVPLEGSKTASLPVASQFVVPWCKVSLRLERLGESGRRKAVLEKHHCFPVGRSAEFLPSELGAS
jgi:DNA repair protein RadB